MNNNLNIKEEDEPIYPDGLSTAGIVLFVLGICLSTWMFVYAI